MLSFDLQVPRLAAAVAGGTWDADDVLAQLIPEGPRAVLEALVRSPPRIEQDGAVRVYPLAIPDGVGIELDTQTSVGVIGIGADDGCVYLDCGRLVAAGVSLKWHKHVVSNGPMPGDSSRRRVRLALPKEGLGLPLGPVGTVRLVPGEAA